MAICQICTDHTRGDNRWYNLNAEESIKLLYSLGYGSDFKIPGYLKIMSILLIAWVQIPPKNSKRFFLSHLHMSAVGNSQRVVGCFLFCRSTSSGILNIVISEIWFVCRYWYGDYQHLPALSRRIASRVQHHAKRSPHIRAVNGPGYVGILFFAGQISKFALGSGNKNLIFYMTLRCILLSSNIWTDRLEDMTQARTDSQIMTFFWLLLIKFPKYEANFEKWRQFRPNTTLNTSYNDILLTVAVNETYDNGVISR